MTLVSPSKNSRSSYSTGPADVDARGAAIVAVNGIRNNGIKPEDVRMSDFIKARCHLFRDGSNGCLLGFVTLFGVYARFSEGGR